MRRALIAALRCLGVRLGLLGCLGAVTLLLVTDVSAQEPPRWLQSLSFEPSPVAGQEARMALVIVSSLGEATDHIRLEAEPFADGGARLSRQKAERVSGDLFQASVTFPAPGLWLLTLTRVRRDLRDAEEVTVAAYVGAPGSPVRAAWLDPDAVQELRWWVSQLGGRSPLNLAEWEVAGLAMDGREVGQVVARREVTITLEVTGNRLWRDIEARALGLKAPDYLTVRFSPVGARRGLLEARADPTQEPWRYRLSVTLPGAGVWRVEPRAVVDGSETVWPGRAISLVVSRAPREAPRRGATPSAPTVAAPRAGDFMPDWVQGALWGVLGFGLAVFAAVRLARGRGLEE